MQSICNPFALETTGHASHDVSPSIACQSGAKSDRIGQPAYAGNIDMNDIAGREGEIVRRDDAGPGQEDGPMREADLSTEPGDEVLQRPGHHRHAGRALEGGLALAL